MKYFAVILVLLVIPVAMPAAGCDSPPPPVTDCASLIENLEYAGASVKVTETSDENKLFAESYIGLHHHAFEITRKGGKVIDPEFLATETNRLSTIQAQADNITLAGKVISVNSTRVKVLEYDSDTSAETDVSYLPLSMNFSITIPTDKGDAYFAPSKLAITLCVYKKDRIIVEYLADSPLSGEDKIIMDLLEHVLGPPFYTED